MILSSEDENVVVKEDKRLVKEKREKIAKNNTKQYKNRLKAANDKEFQTMKKGIFLQTSDIASLAQEIKRAKEAMHKKKPLKNSVNKKLYLKKKIMKNKF